MSSDIELVSSVNMCSASRAFIHMQSVNACKFQSIFRRRIIITMLRVWLAYVCECVCAIMINAKVHYSLWPIVLQCWLYFDKPWCWSPYLLSYLNELFLLPKKVLVILFFFFHTHMSLIYIYNHCFFVNTTYASIRY